MLEVPRAGLNQKEYANNFRRQIAASGIFKKVRTKVNVIMETITEKDGSVSFYRATGTGTSEQLNELVRILKLFAKGDPAKFDGKPVRYRQYQPIQFSFSDGFLDHDSVMDFPLLTRPVLNLFVVRDRDMEEFRGTKNFEIQ